MAQRAQQRVEANRDDYMTLKMARMNPTATPDQIKEIDRALALIAVISRTYVRRTLP